MLNRRTLIAAGLGLPGAAALAQFRVEISGVGATQLPIAVTRFRDEEKAPQPVAAIVRADLERSGYFRPIDGNGTALDETSRPVMSDWRAKNVDALAAGSMLKLADGRYDVRFKLWDVVKGSDLGGQASAVDPADLRLAAHRIADIIYEKLTGDRGVFSTRIAYVTKGGGRYTLRVADADGEGGQVALNSPEPIISPSWSPNGLELAYVSFENQKAVIYAQEVATGKRRVVANFRGSNSAPAWAPDGSTMVATLSREGGSQLFLMDRNGGNVRRLTSSSSIDTEPVFSADGKTIYFISDRSGGPQIYRVSAGGGNPERITFVGSYNVSPAISPDGRTLAYISRSGNVFRLHTLDLSPGAQPVALTDTVDDESPSFAPNGKLIIYATRADGRDVLMTTTLDGRIKARLVSTTADVREPAWGPYGR
ncbi:MAG: Tol-Pal system protein TolB [Piscinibacter sp.]|uniref:Tol-Pal system beta propeller repeat protein TolB n=1 Tax=Piscinibacter sp. TaxID=1903157 RepID=UPI00258BD45C|nr:Tol-Pal system beta propeller repeat protein TolB [Piscinibacter sp.]MCW5662312.1 Tol-Pal system protein TolB [Piscinibacter sp.]